MIFETWLMNLVKLKIIKKIINFNYFQNIKINWFYPNSLIWKN
jgi:hypothetical protein